MSLPFFGVVLDLDGLLLDTERLQMDVGPAVLSAMGHELSGGFFRSLVGVDRETSTRMIEAELGAQIDSSALDAAWNAAMDDRMREGIPLRPGVHDFLEALDRHALPRAIATNSVTERAVWKLTHAGLLDHVDAVVGVDQVARGKPAPDVYVEAAGRLGLKPDQCVALDDSDLGVRAALAAGFMQVIQVPDLLESLERAAHHQVRSLSDARRLLHL